MKIDHLYHLLYHNSFDYVPLGWGWPKKYKPFLKSFLEYTLSIEIVHIYNIVTRATVCLTYASGYILVLPEISHSSVYLYF